MTKALSKSLLHPLIFSLFMAKVKAEILHKKSNTKSYNKTVTDFKLGSNMVFHTLTLARSRGKC